MSLAVVPAGRKLQLINGGAGGNAIDRRCSATVVFYLVADPGE
jgi:lipoprotein signal peptidase